MIPNQHRPAPNMGIFSNKSKEIQDAVDLQMQPLWPMVHGTAFDSSASLDAKQAKIDALTAWANKTEDSVIRKAQLYWISVAQYTINTQRTNRAEKASASKLVPSLPPLPRL